MVERDGFEPPNHNGSELQSDAFSHFATSPVMLYDYTSDIAKCQYFLGIFFA